LTLGAKTSIFNRSASAVTPSEKSSINTKSTTGTRFPMNLGEHRTLSLSQWLKIDL